jgi:hypothetical protein
MAIFNSYVSSPEGKLSFFSWTLIILPVDQWIEHLGKVLARMA